MPQKHLSRVHKDNIDADEFKVPEDIRQSAKDQDPVKVKASTLIALIDEADEALNRDSNDVGLNALFRIREQLSDLYEGG